MKDRYSCSTNQNKPSREFRIEKECNKTDKRFAIPLNLEEYKRLLVSNSLEVKNSIFEITKEKKLFTLY